MCVLSVCMSVYHMMAWYLQNEKRASEPLVLEVRVVVSHHVGDRN